MAFTAPDPRGWSDTRDLRPGIFLNYDFVSFVEFKPTITGLTRITFPTAVQDAFPTPATPPNARRPAWVWWLLGLWLVYSLALMGWHVLSDPMLYGICRTP